MGFSGRSALTADALGAAEIVTLNQFICGLSSEDIGKLQQDAFRFSYAPSTANYIHSMALYSDDFI